MSRREFLKSLSLFTAVSACAFKGGELFASNKNNSNNNPISTKQPEIETYTFDPFKGQKNSGFKFSCPLPFDFKLIDELVNINKKYKKCQLVTLYGSLPDNANPLLTFTSGRGNNNKIKDFNDFAKYVKYAKDKGFNFVYLLNSPRPFFEKEFEYHLDYLNELFDNLKNIGVYNIKIANHQWLALLGEQTEFNIQTSTAMEFNNIRQIENFLDKYPRIKTFNLSIDSNRNFVFLKNLRKIYKDIEFELMADEGCMFGCPARIACISGAGMYSCKPTNSEYCWNFFCRSNIIYPWNLDYYADIGYKNFKFMGVSYGMRPNTRSVAFVRDYFQAVEHGIKGFTINQLLKAINRFETINDAPVTKEFIAQFPDINFFIKNGNQCSVKCGAECDYCLECAKNLDKLVKIQHCKRNTA